MTTVPGGAPFTIDALGNIEVVPPGLNYMIQNSYTLTVTIRDGTFTDTQDLYVQVKDENAGPIILNLPDTISITEDSLGGNVLFTLSPYDIDGDTAICTFSPNPNDGNFDFNSTTYEIGSVTAPSLDAETTSSYEIIVVCNDGMIIGPSAKLTVNVIAVNEPPVILNLPATVTVPEDAFNAAGIFLVDGYDVDGDEVNFTISVSPTSGQSKFSVADVALFDDGQIRIVNNPNFDYETVNQYIITVEASDGIYTATGTLNVDITDVNEPPVFDVDPQDLYMNENTAINSNLPVDLSVTDIDDAPADLKFAVVSSTYSGFFRVVKTPKLRVRAEMNYEDGYPEPFTIQVSVTDSAGNRDYLTVNVYLVNVNDNEPVFTLDPYTVEVKENWPGGMTVLTVTATDDDGDNIEYDIDPYSPYIEVDRNTGDVRLKQSLDRETLGRTIQVTVTATDDGTTPLQGISYINITIKDVNDNQPVFSKEFYDWEIRYDADLGTYINSVTAGDADKGTNAALTYSLLMDHVYFDMDNIGKVSVADGLGVETIYVLFCRAEDSGTPSETSDIAVIRVDAFIPQLVLINVHLGITVGAFAATERTQLLNTLNAIYAPWEFRISAVKSEDVVTSSSRRLLSSNAVLEMYALKTDATEDINNLNLPKEFIYVYALVNSMTKDSEGTPTDVLGSTDIVLVDPTYPSEVVITDINWWLDTLEGRITTGVLSALAFILLLLLLIICCRKCCCHRLAGCCRRCCHRKEKVDLIDDRMSGWELRPKEEPVLEKRRMVIETPPPSPEMMEVYDDPQKPHHKPADEAPPGGNGLGGKFDFRYAGRPHPGGPQTLKAKDRPTLILPSSPSSPQSTNNATNKPFSKPSMVKKNTPTLQRRTGGGRVSSVVSGSDENIDNRFDGSRYDNVTGCTHNFNTPTGKARWNSSPRVSSH
ncbi:protocadherin Fat 1-like [Glandiceps talaboti]